MKKQLKATYDVVLKSAKGAHLAVTKSISDSTAAAPPKFRSRAKLLLLLTFLLLVGIAGFKYATNRQERSRLAQEIAAGPRVRVAKVTKGIGDHRITLIGETRPFVSATLYAKVSGYLKKVMVDKGDVVKEGQVLAIIESPETDEAYVAAQADARNKNAILARMQTLIAKQLVSQQEFDQAQADADVSTARLRSQKTLKSYETIRAPFSGTITARYADAGALLQNATNSESSALPLVMISQIERLRVDIFIDQRDAPFVLKDNNVQITLAERPGFKIDGRVDRISGELDPRTKMLLTEIDIPNENQVVVAGSFVRVSLQVKSPSYLEAPVEALVLKDNKSFLTVVDAQNNLTFKPIEIGSNDGKTLSILSGVQEGDVVALNLGNSMPDGSKVRPILDTPPAAAPVAVAASPAADPAPAPIAAAIPTAASPQK